MLMSNGKISTFHPKIEVMTLIEEFGAPCKTYNSNDNQSFLCHKKKNCLSIFNSRTIKLKSDVIHEIWHNLQVHIFLKMFMLV